MKLLSQVSGIDEAGRGSVFGSLIIAGITLDEKSVKNLLKNGLKDSKLFLGPQGKKLRSELALKIQELALESKIIKISAIEIDQVLNKRPNDNLNLLEIRNIGKLIIELSSNNITVDSLSKPQYSKKHLVTHLKSLDESITINTESCESEICFFKLKRTGSYTKKINIAKKADLTYPVVSAASCVAKFVRDQSLREIEDEWNLPAFSLGQGYPNEKDTKVMSFLQSYCNEIQKRIFPFIRYSWSWSPLQQLIRSPPKPLDEFFDR